MQKRYFVRQYWKLGLLTLILLLFSPLLFLVYMVVFLLMAKDIRYGMVQLRNTLLDFRLVTTDSSYRRMPVLLEHDRGTEEQ